MVAFTPNPVFESGWGSTFLSLFVSTFSPYFLTGCFDLKNLSELDLYFKIPFLFFFFSTLICFQRKRDQNINSTCGSVVEFSPATREARVRFPASANYLLLDPLFNLLGLNFMLYINGCFHPKPRF